MNRLGSLRMARAIMAMVMAALTPMAALAEAGKRPNVILIVADDLGWAEVGCYGQKKIQTPHLDRMAKEGMRFTQFYSAAEVCTPSRAALLTGRYPIRSGMCHTKMRVLRNPNSHSRLRRRSRSYFRTSTRFG
jgi:arylsulfatase A-like enzyme